MGFSNGRFAVVLVAGLLLAASPAKSTPKGRLQGSLVGFVSNHQGVPQMGAAVLVYNHYNRLVGRAVTNGKGAFGFDSLLPGLYSVRVSLTSFVPALKEKIQIQAGVRSFLNINLASVLSSIELMYTAPGETSLMSDDWKWVLRTASTTRPVLRIGPGIDVSDPNKDAEEKRGSMFADTRGVLKVSTGEQGSLAAAGAQTDLGTAFALATSLFGANELQFSGNFGYASHAGAPTAGFRTSYNRADPWGAMPEVNVTMRQVFLPAYVGSAAIGGGETPLLRTLSVSTMDKRQIGENMLLEYGGSMESVAYLERLNYFSPFARFTYEMGAVGSLQVAYSSGMPPAELLAASDAPELDLQQDLTVLAMFPRLSLRGGNPHVQRAQNIELAWRKALGTRTISVGAYREAVTNSAVMMAAPSGYLSSADLLPDLSSNSSVFNIGDFYRLGFVASLTQQIGEDYSAAIAYGSGGVLEPVSGLLTADPNELRESLTSGRRDWLAARFTGFSPWTGTRFSASYKWTDYSVLAPTHLYLTQGFQPNLGLNIAVRQPLPSVGVWSGRLEASAELRNLLAEGYVPVSTHDGRRLYLIHNPRAIRGGLSFIF
ncbi:MAG: carboxypeptidase regulatory-like domain-containing protein [bacterium]|nr:carboxypeptidase regulatory-like domain-containing protein [bacterium]